MARTRARKPTPSRSRASQAPRRGTPPSVVLIVEDEPDLRVLAESNIADFGYETLSAANAVEALVLLEENENIVVLFTDINLSDGPDSIDGLELARRAVELRAGLRVVYTTGGVQTDGMTALFVEGGAFLPKPYTREQLKAALRGDPTPADQ